MNGFSGIYKLDPAGWAGGWFGKELYEFTNDDADPLTCELGGSLFRPDHHYITDLGSVPKTLQYLCPKWFAKDRYPVSYLFHDSAYKRGAVWMGVPGGWKEMKLTRKAVDVMLRDMIILEGGGRANAQAIYAGVRLGGWASWDKEAPKQAETYKPL